MKSSIWERSFVKKVFKLFAIGKVLIFSADIFAQPAATAVIENPNELRIIKKEDSSEVGIFQISVYQEPQKNIDGSLELQLKIETTFPGVIKYGNQRIAYSADGMIFSIKIPADELSNQTFYREIILTDEQDRFFLEKIKLKIDPSVEISTDVTRVDFGKISLESGCVIADSPSAVLKYSILKDAICVVTSKNNFQLKHKNKEKFIPYSMNGMTANGEFILRANKSEIEAKFRIEPLRNLPQAGEYTDKITFSIQSEM